MPEAPRLHTHTDTKQKQKQTMINYWFYLRGYKYCVDSNTLRIQFPAPL